MRNIAIGAEWWAGGIDDDGATARGRRPGVMPRDSV